jgi:hypothetical protein
MKYPNRIALRRRGQLAAAAALLLLALAGAAGATEPGAHPDHLIVLEGEMLFFTPEELLSNDVLSGGPPELFVLQPPVHGSLACDPAWCTYQPAAGWYGVDRFRYGVHTPGQGFLGDAQVVVWVSPLVTPVAGDWNGDGLTDVGWFHARTLDFYFAVVEGEPGGDLHVETTTCARPSLPAGSEGWIPFAGDWDGNGRDDVAVFDPLTRTYHQFVLEQWTLRHHLSTQHPAPAFGGLPVAGDWDAAGGDEVGLFLPEAAELRLLTPGDDAAPSAVGWSFGYALPAGNWFPFAAELASTSGGPDRIAVWDRAGRAVRYRLDFTGGATSVIDDYDGQGIGLRALPFGGRWGSTGTIGLFDPDQVTERSWTGAYRIFRCDFDPSPTCDAVSGGNEPILLPIPEDPLAALCVK